MRLQLAGKPAQSLEQRSIAFHINEQMLQIQYF